MREKDLDICIVSLFLAVIVTLSTALFFPPEKNEEKTALELSKETYAIVSEIKEDVSIFGDPALRYLDIDEAKKMSKIDLEKENLKLQEKIKNLEIENAALASRNEILNDRLSEADEDLQREKLRNEK